MTDRSVKIGPMCCKSFWLSEGPAVQIYKFVIQYFKVQCPVRLIPLSTQLYVISNLHFYLTLLIIILLSGDIESNPGPMFADENLKLISIAHLNVRSIRNKLELLFTDLSDHDILCFTETHLDDKVSDSYLLNECSNFTLYRRDLPAHSGGVVVYVSNRLFSKRRPDLELPSVQSIWLEIRHQSNSFLLCSTYRPPNSPVSIWDDLNVSIERALDISPNVILLGDLNENLLNENLAHLKNIMLINDLRNIIDTPTRITEHSSTLIDPIIVSNNVDFYRSGCYDVKESVSDHRVTFIFLKSSHESHECLKRKVWYYNRADFGRLNELIEKENWDFIDFLTVDDSCNKFTEILLNYMSDCIPSKDVTIRPNDKPWYDSELRRFTTYLDRQRKIALKSNTESSWNKYKKLRNKVNNLKKFAKKNFYDHIESRIEDDSLNNRRNYWKTLKDLMNNFKSADSIPVLSRNINGIDKYYFTNQEKANCLNEYFTSVSNLDDSNTNLPPFESKVDMSLEHIQIEEQEIEKNIEILAVGPDLISHKVLKGVKYSICKPLSRLFNK